MDEMDRLRYPIGPFEWDGRTDLLAAREGILRIAELPSKLSELAERCSEEQLNTPYRPGGWTARQVIHHVADSHMNAFIRFKFALTEDQPVIKPYPEALWAQLSDSYGSIQISLPLIEALHFKWVVLLYSLAESDLAKGYYHPEQQRVVTLAEAIQLYAWHGEHHCGHVRLMLDV